MIDLYKSTKIKFWYKNGGLYRWCNNYYQAWPKQKYVIQISSNRTNGKTLKLYCFKYLKREKKEFSLSLNLVQSQKNDNKFDRNHFNNINDKLKTWF